LEATELAIDGGMVSSSLALLRMAINFSLDEGLTLARTVPDRWTSEKSLTMPQEVQNIDNACDLAGANAVPIPKCDADSQRAACEEPGKDFPGSGDAARDSSPLEKQGSTMVKSSKKKSTGPENNLRATATRNADFEEC